jgi:outer membrane immunogenic protein
MKKYLIALLFFSASSGIPAFAQSVSSWSGPYLGAQFGYGFGRMSSYSTNLVGTFPVPHESKPDGVLGGLHAGYDFQTGRFVFGLEGDIEAAALDGRTAVDAFSVTYTSRTTSNFDASIRERAGIVFDQFLLYGTGGVAWGQVKIAYGCDGCVSAAGATSTLNDIRAGWTAGVGAEYRVNPDLSLRIEYRYTDLGEKRRYGSGCRLSRQPLQL